MVVITRRKGIGRDRGLAVRSDGRMRRLSEGSHGWRAIVAQAHRTQAEEPLPRPLQSEVTAGLGARTKVTMCRLGRLESMAAIRGREGMARCNLRRAPPSAWGRIERSGRGGRSRADGLAVSP